MKKNLLLLLMVLTYAVGNAQVVFYVQPPSDLEGSYTMTYADGTDWGSADLTDPANAVVGELVFIYDASATEDSLICEDPGSVVTDCTGKIAMLYRGACEFGRKALSAQEAGAIAVVIITYPGEEPVGLGGGEFGGQVTIPVVMISRAAAEALKPSVADGGVEAFIGNKTGFYENDIGFRPRGVVRAKQNSSIQLLSQDDTEFSVDVSSWVTNFGSLDQTNVVFSAEIMMGGSSVYSETAAAVDILAGDSAYISLPMYSQASYDNGLYELVYSLTSDADDDFPSDDMFDAPFTMSDSLYSFAHIADEAAGPDNVTFFRPSTPSGEIHSCVAFFDANGSRVGAKGMTFAATSTTDVPIDGEVISVYAYEWTLEFEDVNDEAYTGVSSADLDLLASGFYEYSGEDMAGENVYAAFEETVMLDDGIRYLFCIAYESDDIFTGYNASKLDYTASLDSYLQPQFPNSDGTDFFLVGFGLDVCPGVAVHLFDANPDAIEEIGRNIDVTPYPNPAQNFVKVPLVDVNGLTTVQIFDVTGKLVDTQAISVSSGQTLQINVSNLDEGVYTFGLRYENGNVSNFNVVIAK